MNENKAEGDATSASTQNRDGHLRSEYGERKEERKEGREEGRKRGRKEERKAGMLAGDEKKDSKRGAPGILGLGSGLGNTVTIFLVVGGVHDHGAGRCTHRRDQLVGGLFVHPFLSLWRGRLFLN